MGLIDPGAVAPASSCSTGPLCDEVGGLSQPVEPQVECQRLSSRWEEVDRLPLSCDGQVAVVDVGRHDGPSGLSHDLADLVC